MSRDAALRDRMSERMAELRTLPGVRAAERALRDEDERTLDTQIELSEIPSPPFGESARGRRMAELFAAAGLAGVETDAVGNVLAHAPPLADRDAPSARPALLVSAHLDTVFPPGTDVAVTRDGDLLRGPGISDDARGLASLLAIARALESSGVRTRTPLTFVATVGEEGIGDLRGVKHLFREDGGFRDASGFISLDGAGLERLVVRGLGSRRFRITCLGPGGHSWVDWGAPNPIPLIAGVIRRLGAIPLSNDPLTTLTVARQGGGTSINAIPQHAWIEVDTRCEVDEGLALLEKELRRAVSDCGGDTPRELSLEVESVGSRPGGATDPSAPLVRAAIAATESLGLQPELATSSTDANIPMARGIPALALGCGGEAGKAHTTDEWFRNTRGADGPVRALYTILLAAGVETT